MCVRVCARVGGLQEDGVAGQGDGYTLVFLGPRGRVYRLPALKLCPCVWEANVLLPGWLDFGGPLAGRTPPCLPTPGHWALVAPAHH